MPPEAAPGRRPLLAACGLTKSFRGLVALKDHRLEVRPGEILGVIGPNGSGKSTLFNLITGFTRPHAGEISLGGRPVPPPHRRRDHPRRPPDPPPAPAADRAARHRPHLPGYPPLPPAHRAREH